MSEEKNCRKCFFHDLSLRKGSFKTENVGGRNNLWCWRYEKHTHMKKTCFSWKKRSDSGDPRRIAQNLRA